MKRNFIIQFFLFCSFCAFSQLKVLQDGNVGIGVSQPLSLFSIGTEGSSKYTAHVEALRACRGLNINRTGYPSLSYDYMWHFGLYCYNEIQNDCFNVGGRCGALYSTPRKSGRAFGFIGYAGNSTTGYNYGVVGALSGDQEGTGILGTMGSDISPAIYGRFAGYFAGDVAVTGSLTVTEVKITSDLRCKQNIV